MSYLIGNPKQAENDLHACRNSTELAATWALIQAVGYTDYKLYKLKKEYERKLIEFEISTLISQNVIVSPPIILTGVQVDYLVTLLVSNATEIVSQTLTITVNT